MSKTAVDVLKALRLHDQKMGRITNDFTEENVKKLFNEIWERTTYSRMFCEAWSLAQFGVAEVSGMAIMMAHPTTGHLVNPYKNTPDSTT